MALVQWLHTQVDDRLNDEELMALAAEGARALDKREAAYAKRVSPPEGNASGNRKVFLPAIRVTTGWRRRLDFRLASS